MPRFIAKPPVYEARQYVGDAVSTVEIQGWLLGSNIESEHFEAVGNEGEADYVPARIEFGDEIVEAGEWLMRLPSGTEFQVMSASELYTQYTQV